MEGGEIMTARELVDICDKCKTCFECKYDNLCIAYEEQFGCLPFDAKFGFDLNCNPTNLKANSDTKINF